MLKARDDIGAQLDRVLASPRFERSKRNSELLAYLVREVRAGRGEAISGTSVAQDVFGKGAEFDPATDPSVRVQMGRLRKMLAEHYADEGAAEEWRIVLSKASYEPTLVPAAACANGEPKAGATHEPSLDRGAAHDRPLAVARRHPVVAGMVALSVLLLALTAVLRTGDGALALPSEPIRNYPVIHVQPFANNTGDGSNDVLQKGLQRQVAADLERFHVARVALEGAGTGEGSAAPDFVLAGTVLATEPQLDMIVQLISTEDSAVVDSQRMVMERGEDYYETLELLSKKLSSDFGGPSGRLTKTLWERFRATDGDADATMEGDLAAFRCLARFHVFENARTLGEHGAVRDCLALHSGRNPEDGTLLSALAWTLLVGSAEAGLLDTTNLNPPHDPRYALELAERAVAIDPANDDAHEYLGLIEWFNGYHDRALASLRRALGLNSANARHRANYALFSTLAGETERGTRLMREAIDWSLDPPSWYHSAFFYDALVDGNGERALEVLDQGSAAGDPFEPIYRFAAASIAGRADEVERLLPTVRAHAGARDGDPLDGIRIWLAETEALRIIARELERHGIDVPEVQRASMLSAFQGPRRDGEG